MSTERPTSNQAANTSPFATHRNLILGLNSTGVVLADIVLSCWGGSSYPVNLSRLASMDGRYRTAAFEMMNHYARHGERDPVFMALADEILAERKERAAQLAKEQAEED